MLSCKRGLSDESRPEKGKMTTHLPSKTLHLVSQEVNKKKGVWMFFLAEGPNFLQNRRTLFGGWWCLSFFVRVCWWEFRDTCSSTVTAWLLMQFRVQHFTIRIWIVTHKCVHIRINQFTLIAWGLHYCKVMHKSAKVTLTQKIPALVLKLWCLRVKVFLILRGSQFSFTQMKEERA